MDRDTFVDTYLLFGGGSQRQRDHVRGFGPVRLCERELLLVRQLFPLLRAVGDRNGAVVVVASQELWVVAVFRIVAGIIRIDVFFERLGLRLHQGILAQALTRVLKVQPLSHIYIGEETKKTPVELIRGNKTKTKRSDEVISESLSSAMLLRPDAEGAYFKQGALGTVTGDNGFG